MVDKFLDLAENLARLNIWKVFSCVLILKFLQVWFLFELTSCSSPDRVMGFMAISSGDTSSYFEPVINYFTKGEYFFLNEWGEKVYAGRMPLYGLLFWLMDAATAGHGHTGLAFLQLFLEAFSICYVYRYIAAERNKETWAMLFLLVLLISSYTSAWILKMQPESISTSLLLILVVLFSRDRPNVFISSILLVILVMFKPYFGLIYIVFGFKYLIAPMDRKVHILMALAAPLIIVLSLWTVRNFQILGKLIPLTETRSGYAYSQSELEMRKLAGSMGLGFESWDVKSFGCWMTYENCEYSPPAYILESTYIDSLENLKRTYVPFMDSLKNSRQNIEFDLLLSYRINRLNKAYKESFPLRYTFLSPIYLIRDFVIHSGTYYYPLRLVDPECGNRFTTFDKLCQSFIYILTLCLGIPGLLMMVRNHMKAAIFSISVIGIILILFPFILRFIELRFFLQAFPFLALGASYLLVRALFWNHLSA